MNSHVARLHDYIVPTQLISLFEDCNNHHISLGRNLCNVRRSIYCEPCTFTTGLPCPYTQFMLSLKDTIRVNLQILRLYNRIVSRIVTRLLFGSLECEAVEVQSVNRIAQQKRAFSYIYCDERIVTGFVNYLFVSLLNDLVVQLLLTLRDNERTCFVAIRAGTNRNAQLTCSRNSSGNEVLRRRGLTTGLQTMGVIHECLYSTETSGVGVNCHLVVRIGYLDSELVCFKRSVSCDVSSCNYVSELNLGPLVAADSNAFATV